MTHLSGGSNSPESLRKDRVASTADRVPDLDGQGLDRRDEGAPSVGSDSASQQGADEQGTEQHGLSSRATHDGGKFLEEPPTVISSQKDRDPEATTSRHQSLTELTLGRELVGQTLGHFQLDAFVGAGGMGAVFRGHDTRLGRRVAVKVLSGEHNTREDTVRRFRNEAQSAARLDHPNIARVYFEGEDKGWNYIVFEFIDGVNVRDQVERYGPLEVELAISYLVQVAEALDHASKRDVVHRDIKPSNILVDVQHRAKLVDMGLARLHQVNSPDNDLTASGMTLGTFDYISPEQARDPRSADVRSDLYSLGCTFFFMLTGRPPFPEGTVLQKLLSHSSEEPPDPREFRADVPDEVVQILSRLMAKNPNDRYQQPGELIAAALVAIDDLGLAAPHVTSAVYVPMQEQRTTLLERHLPWALPTIILLVVVFVLDAIWTAKDDSFISGVSYLSADEMRSLADDEELSDIPSPIKEAPTIEAGNVIPLPVEPAKKPEPQPSAPPPATEEKTVSAPAEPIATPAAPAEAASPAPVPVAETPAADGGASTPAKGAASASGTDAATPPAAEMNVVVVPDQAATVYEAITKAQADSQINTIELRYDGPRYERPLLVQNTSLTIRAGQNFQPTIVFTPQEEEPVDRMILVSESSLTLEGLQIRMTVPQSSMRAWSLFVLQDADRLVLRGCQVTVHREDESLIPDVLRDTSVVSIRPVQVAEAIAEMASMRSSLISFDDCLIRGEASLVRSTGQQVLRIFSQNSLLAVSGSLLNSNSTATESVVGGLVHLKMTGCTVDTGAGLIRRDGGSSIPLQVSLSDSAVRWNEESPLLMQRSSVQSTDAMLKSIRFIVDSNCYQQQETPLTMMQLESTSDGSSPVKVNYAGWVRMWEDHFSERSTAIWKSIPPPEVPFSSRTLEDYLLLDDPLNPAIRPNEGNAGVDFQKLPFAAAEHANTGATATTD